MENKISIRTTRLPAYLISADNDSASDSLANKFNRQMRQQQDTVYEVSSDIGFLHQYYGLRDNMFMHLAGLEGSSGKKEACDDESDIVIARIGNHCVGGGRLTFSSKKDRKMLPMEQEEVYLAKALPSLALADTTIVEISRTAILPELQNGVIALELFRQLIAHAAQKKARYAFMLTPRKTAGNHNKAASLFGLKWQIMKDVIIPDREEFDGIRMVLSMLDLSPLIERTARKNTKLLAIAD